MEECKPKWIVWENVPDAISRKNMPNFQNYMDELDSLNYNTYYKVLNAHELGSAQKRKRLFSISIRKDIDNGKFEFLDLTREPKHLETYLENNDQPDIANEHIHSHLILGKDENGYKIKNGTKKGYLYANNGDGIDYSFEEMKDTLESIQESAEGKVINIGKVIQKYQDDIKVINERKKALDELKKKAERNIDNLKQYGLVQMSRLDMKKVASPTLTVSIRNSKVMNIKDESKLPKEYITEKVEKKVDKAAFKKYYNGLSTEEQEAIDYAEIEVKQNILIK